MCCSGLHMGSIIGLLISPAIIQYAGWQTLFTTCGAAGMWLVCFWVYIFVVCLFCLNSSASHQPGRASEPSVAGIYVYVPGLCMRVSCLSLYLGLSLNPGWAARCRFALQCARIIPAGQSIAMAINQCFCCHTRGSIAVLAGMMHEV